MPPFNKHSHSRDVTLVLFYLFSVFSVARVKRICVVERSVRHELRKTKLNHAVCSEKVIL